MSSKPCKILLSFFLFQCYILIRSKRGWKDGRLMTLFFLKKLAVTDGKRSGFTLIEMLLATFILAPIYLMTMLSFINTSQLNDSAKNTALALRACANQIETIDSTSFDQIYAAYHNATFTFNGLEGIGSVYVDNTQPKVLTITTSFCWKDPSERIIGEDHNLNGQLDPGEDLNNNGLIDSPVKLVTVKYDT
jgi:prepilin-type N-terminal cleavage/methylation domain-containing protein